MVQFLGAGMKANVCIYFLRSWSIISWCLFAQTGQKEGARWVLCTPWWLKAAALVHLEISICSYERSNGGCGCLCMMNIQNKCQMNQFICSSFSVFFFASPLPHVPKKREIVESHCLPKCKLLGTSCGHLVVLSFVCFGYKRQIPWQTDAMGNPCLWGEGNRGFSSIGLQSFSEYFYSDALCALSSLRLFRSSRQIYDVGFGRGHFKGIILPPLTWLER